MAPVSCFGMNREECEVVVGRWRVVSLPSGLPARYSHGGCRAEGGWATGALLGNVRGAPERHPWGKGTAAERLARALGAWTATHDRHFGAGRH